MIAAAQITRATTTMAMISIAQARSSRWDSQRWWSSTRLPGAISRMALAQRSRDPAAWAAAVVTAMSCGSGRSPASTASPSQGSSSAATALASIRTFDRQNARRALKQVDHRSAVGPGRPPAPDPTREAAPRPASCTVSAPASPAVPALGQLAGRHAAGQGQGGKVDHDRDQKRQIAARGVAVQRDRLAFAPSGHGPSCRWTAAAAPAGAVAGTASAISCGLAISPSLRRVTGWRKR